MKSLHSSSTVITGHRNPIGIFVIESPKNKEYYLATSPRSERLEANGKNSFASADQAIENFLIEREKIKANFILASTTPIQLK